MRSPQLIVIALSGWMMGTACAQTASSRAPCMPTPAAALVHNPTPRSDSLAGAHGFRLEAVRWDPLLKQNWAVIQNCDHLDQASITVPTERSASYAGSHTMRTLAFRSLAVVPIVRVGDLVRLWKSESYAHLEMMGTSEENGAVGTRVRVRLLATRDLDGQISPPQYLAGVVRGPADVELAQ